MLRIRLIWLGISWLWPVSLISQVNPFFPDPGSQPPYCDTIYYPVRDGVQMIEFDFESAFQFHLMSYHDRGYVPPYPGKTHNEYLFRDTAGTILRSYGIAESIAKGIAPSLAPVSHQTRDSHTHRLQPFEHYLHHKNHGYYNFYIENRQGIIDSMGNVFIPAEYDGIYHLSGGFLIYQDDLWTLVPLTEPDRRIGPFRSYHDKGPFIYFFDAEGYSLVYHLESGNQVDLKAYRLSTFDEERGYLMRYEGGKWGLWDVVNDEVLIPYEYDRIVTYHAYSDWRYFESGICLVLRDGKYGLVGIDGFIHLSCKYDRIYPEQESPSGFYKVELGGETFEIEIP